MEQFHKLFKFFFRINFFKTLYYSVRYKGLIIVGKASINIGANSAIVLSHGSKLLIGLDYSYPVKTILDIYDNANLYVDGKVSICRGCKIVLYEGASLSIGGGTYINECTRIHCSNLISIGKRCAIAFECLVMDSDLHNIITDNNIVNPMSKVIIGDHVWIGAKAIILKGSEIEDNVIIASGSLVTKKCLSNNIYVGNMLRPITEFDSWE